MKGIRFELVESTQRFTMRLGRGLLLGLAACSWRWLWGPLLQ